TESPASMPELTKPKVKKAPDSAALKHQGERVSSVAYTTSNGIRAKARVVRPAIADARPQSPKRDVNNRAECGAPSSTCNIGPVSGAIDAQLALFSQNDVNATAIKSIDPSRREVAEDVPPTRESQGVNSADSDIRSSDANHRAANNHTTL